MAGHFCFCARRISFVSISFTSLAALFQSLSVVIDLFAAAKMQNYILARVLFALSFLQAALAVSAPASVPEIAPRQTTAVSSDGSMPLQCMEYSRIANLSTIGANSSYRAPFMAASPVGTSINAAMLDGAIAKLPAMKMDQALNDMCGNLTTIALAEAERNLTLRTVAQFDNVPAITVNNGLAVIFTTVAALVLICGTSLAV